MKMRRMLCVVLCLMMALAVLPAQAAGVPTKIAFAEKAITMNLGETRQLEAILTPEDAETTLTWKSSKATVVEVNAETGAATALKEGKATITVKTANKKSAKLKITVVDPKKPTGIEIDKTGTILMNVGDTITVGYTLLPAGVAEAPVTIKSSNAKIASVDAETGEVTAVKKGTAKITVTELKGKKKATFKVKVSVPSVPAGPVELGGFLYKKYSALKAAVPGLKKIGSKEGTAAYERTVPCGSGKATLNINATTVVESIGLFTEGWTPDGLIEGYTIMGICPGMTLSEASNHLKEVYGGGNVTIEYYPSADEDDIYDVTIKVGEDEWLWMSLAKDPNSSILRGVWM